MKLLATLFLLAASYAAAQSFEAAMPANWGGCGVGYNGSHGDGWCSIAVLVAPKEQIYSYSTYDQQLVNHRVTSSVRTGFAPVLRHYTLGKGWDIALLGMAVMGTTQTPTNHTLGSLSGGGQLFIHHGMFTFNVGLRQATGPEPGPFIEVGVGFDLGK
jgi:hypothetical protein